MYALLLLHLLIFFLSITASSCHLVKPSCSIREKVCEFHFDIHYMETMVHFTKDISMGVPVVYRNGTFYKRDPISCDVLEELDKAELLQVITADGSNKLLFAINGQFPGPPIVVYEGQTVVVNVVNKLINEGLTIHWHGIVQKETPWMDGASMLTQCPINPGELFQYRFKADPVGTHWYHSHHGTQRTEGMTGPLIVLPKPENNRHDIPDVDQDFIMMLQDWTRNSTTLEVNMLQQWKMSLYSNERNSSVCYHKTHTDDNTNVGSVPFHSALINGKGHFYPKNDEVPDLPELPLEIFTVKHDQYFRLRIINAALMYPFRISIDQHRMEVISTDGYDVMPFMTEAVIVASGERVDIIAKADAEIENYWIRVENLATRNHFNNPITPGKVLGILRYEGAKDKFPRTERRQCTKKRPCTVVNCPFLHYPSSKHIHCIPLTDLKSTDALLRKYPVPVPIEGEIEEIFINFHLAANDKDRYLPAVNSRTFQFPSCPPQVTYEPGSKRCFDDCNDHNCENWCKCTHTIKLEKLDKPVQMVLINNDDLPNGPSHPIHIHGHGVHVVKVAYAKTEDGSGVIIGENPDITCSGKDCRNPHWTNKDWKYGNVPDVNIKNPPIKDTVVVPRNGYVVIRFPTDNPGYWYMHCHVETHQLEGMTVILKEGLHREMIPPPPHFPLCGGFKWTQEKFEQHLQQWHNNYPKTGFQSAMSISTEKDNTMLESYISNDVIKQNNTEDLSYTVALDWSMFSLIIIVSLIVFLFMITAILCLCKAHGNSVLSILRPYSVKHYGSIPTTMSNK